MKIKSSELIGPALVWAVAILEFPKGSYSGEADHYSGNNNERWIRVPDTENRTYVLAKYPTDWAQGGPIIEREKIDCVADPNGKDVWMGQLYATRLSGEKVIRAYGPTPLIAAMRCYVASKLGDEVDVPEELI